MMNTSKPRLTVATLASASLLVAACGNGGGDDGDTTTLRAGTIYDPSVPVVECGLEELANSPELEEVGLEIEVFASAQLGGESELLEQASSGELDIALGIGSVVASTFGIPGPAMFEAYYLYDSVDDVERVQDTDVAEEIWQTVEDEANLVSMGTPWLYGERHIFGSEPITGPESMNGTTLRVPNTDISRDSADALGADVATTEYDELFLALQQGVVDVAEAPLPNINAESFDEVSDYVSLTRHLITTHGVLINADIWDGLSEEQHDVLSEQTDELAASVAECLEAEEQEALDEWAEAGTPEVIEDVDRDAMADLVQELYSDGYEWSDDYVELLEELGEQ
ncbi:TRAP transporter substrate-binding protein DctP [Nesterenkonia haasae]|uniref:TRAP transporter substrate-binding protein DctP n=1 Tax=Nesterenkonia haasae TaxID=2587813 RepID=UPI001391B392|nr:TRAP transporter substrate-binding protein DctP [Nesterenkonia haasae]